MKTRSNEPFWLVKNGLNDTYPSLKENIDTDILIVGGGITGALMANACCKAGFLTALVDKREIANGSTAATTAMLQYEIDVPLYKLMELVGEAGAVASYVACRDAIYQLRELVKEIQSDCGFDLKQSLYFAASKQDLKWLLHEYKTRLDKGFDVVWMNKENIKTNFSIAAEGGILSADGASVDAFCLAKDILRYNVKRGLNIFDKTALTKVKYLSGGIVAKTDTDRQITAKKIIYCTGYESQALLPEKVVNLKSTYAMVSEQQNYPTPNWDKTLFWNTDSPYLYMRTTNDGRLLMGGGDENFKNPLKRDALLGRKAEKLHRLFEKMTKAPYYPDFAWCGTFGETKDGLPYIGSHPKFKHSYFCLGFGGNGITFSVIGAKMVVDMIQGRPSPLAHFFRFGR